MPVVVLFIIFVVLLVIAVPVSITLGITSVLPSVFDPSFTVGAKYLIRAMFGGLDSFPLLAVPMFVLSGIIMADLQEAIAKHRPGDKVKVKLIRNKKEKTVEVTLKNEQGTTKIVKDAGMEILGAAFKELPDDLKKQLNLGYGLQVTGVSSGKMSDAGVRKGFIILKANDQPMRKVSDLEEVMKAAVKSPNQVLFLTGVFPSGKRGYFAVDLTQE